MKYFVVFKRADFLCPFVTECKTLVGAQREAKKHHVMAQAKAIEAESSKAAIDLWKVAVDSGEILTLVAGKELVAKKRSKFQVQITTKEEIVIKKDDKFLITSPVANNSEYVTLESQVPNSIGVYPKYTFHISAVPALFSTK